MKLQTLKYFCVLAEELHFRRAAERLAISQPPLSLAIRLLEEDLGTPLFVRNSKMVELTSAGAAFLFDAREILDRVARSQDRVRAIGSGAQGRLDIGITGSLLYREVTAILQHFRRAAPDVAVVLHELSTAEHLDKLGRRQLDAAFVQGASAPSPLQAMALADDQYVICLPEAHPLASARSVRLAQLAGESFIMFSRQSAPANHDNLIAIFSRAGIHPKIVHSARVWLTIVSMVGEGLGVALAPRSLAKSGMTGVRFVPLAGPAEAASAMLVWNPGAGSRLLELFLESARQTLQTRKKKPQATGR